MYIWFRINRRPLVLFRIKPDATFCQVTCSQALVDLSTWCSDFIRFRIKPKPLRRSKRIRRTPDPFSTTVQYVSVDHRRGHVFVAEQFLNRADVVAVLKQVRGKRMPQRM